jgi:hypothetical protein
VPHLLTDNLRENERNMQGPCCHSWMLPNGTAGIILWLIASHGYSSIYHHVACESYREMMWSQNRDLIFRANNWCLQSYGIPVASMLSTDSQIILKWTAPILWQIRLFRSNRQSFLEEGRRMKKICDSSRQLLSSHKSGVNRLA